MKKLFIASLLVLFSLCGYSQVAYYDANSLNQYVNVGTGKFKTDTNSLKIVCGIIKKYCPDLPNKSNWDDVKSAITTKSPHNPDYNPILAPFFDITPPLGAENITTAGSIINSIGNTNVSSIANGVTSFLVKRAKEELLIAVINKLKDPTKFPEIPVLFPNTFKLMKDFDAWDYANVLNTLKEAFDKDLQQLLVDIPKLSRLIVYDSETDKLKADTPKVAPAVAKRVHAIRNFLLTDQGRILMSVMQIGNGIVIGEKIPDIIHTIADTSYLGNVKSAGTAIKFVDIISYSLRNQTKGKNYVSKAGLDSLLNDPVSLNIYLGLLYQQMANENIKFSSLTTNNDLDTILISKGFRTYVDSVALEGNEVNTAIDDLASAKKNGQKDLSTYWSEVFESTNQLLATATNLSVINSNLKFPPQVKTIIQYSSTTLSLVNDITIRNYSAAVLDITLLIPKESNGSDSSTFKKYFLKYGSFAANLVQAKSADDAENAIESVALPVGSYTIKQQSHFNISLNGYVGYAFDINDHFKKLYAQGIYAPLGFSFSMGTKCFFSNVTAFISPVDLGNLVSYQLSNPTTATTSSSTGSTSQTSTTSTGSPEIKLSNIFSPSAQLFFGIKGTPFAFGAGWRRTPTLHYSGGTNYSTVGAKEVFTANILIDIPIFTLLNTPYRK